MNASFQTPWPSVVVLIGGLLQNNAMTSAPRLLCNKCLYHRSVSTSISLFWLPLMFDRYTNIPGACPEPIIAQWMVAKEQVWHSQVKELQSGFLHNLLVTNISGKLTTKLEAMLCWLTSVPLYVPLFPTHLKKWHTEYGWNRACVVCGVQGWVD